MSTPVVRCPPASDLIAFTDGALSPHRRNTTIVHLDRCRPCREAVAAAVDSDLVDVGDPLHAPKTDGPRPGTRLGRYWLKSSLGAGAMGAVFAADDPALQRTVAVKVVQSTRFASARARRRLLLEARAMAQLSHPNVVTVYDAGTCAWGAYVVMECVTGQSLRAWSAGRSWQAIVAAFIDAGQGLAAAHDAGMIHRDFKPANVLVGTDGRARVTDFGLVAADPSSASGSGNVSWSNDASSVPGEPIESVRSNPADRSAIPRLTRTGGMVGTPAYLAPERFEGHPATARSDQFAFCVALAQLVYGHRPTVGRTVRELASNSVHTANHLELRDSAAPARLAEILRRGLAPKPADRYASMHELVDDLRSLVRRRRTALHIATLVAGVGLLVGAALATGDRREVRPSCDALAGWVSDSWSWAVREQLEQRLRAGSTGSAREAAHLVTTRLDRYARQWAETRRSLCRATTAVELDAVDDRASVDAGLRCLDRRLAELDAFLAVSLDPQTTVGQATAIATTLDSPRACLQARGASPAWNRLATPAQRAESRALWGKLAEVSAWMKVYRFEAAQQILREHRGAVERLGDPRLAGRARLLEAILDGLLGHEQDSIDALTRLYADAVAQGDPELASRSALALATTLIEGPADDDGAERWTRTALSQAERAASSRWQLEAIRTWAHIELLRGRLQAAAETANRGLALAESLPNQRTTEATAHLHNTLGNVALVLRRYEAAERSFQRARQLYETHYGSRHPRTIEPLMGLIQVALSTGRPEEAERLLELRDSFLAVAADVHGRQRIFSLAMRGRVASASGHWGAALEYLDAAVESAIATRGPEHPDLVVPRTLRASSRLAAGQPEAALQDYVAVVDLCRNLSGHVHACNGKQYLGRGRSRVALGQLEEGLEDFQTAQDMIARTHGDDSIVLAEPLIGAGRVLVELGRPHAAIARLRLARSLLAEDPSRIGSLAAADFALAKALTQSDPSAASHEEASMLARRALAGFGHQPAYAERADDVARWLAVLADARDPAPTRSR